MAKHIPIAKAVVASAARTATGNSGNLDGTAQALPSYPADIKLIFDVTANSGTSELLDVTVEDSPDGGTTWYEIGHFTQISATTGIHIALIRNYFHGGDAAAEAVETAAGTFINGPIAVDHRVVWTIAGTNPSFTFALWAVYHDAILS